MDSNNNNYFGQSAEDLELQDLPDCVLETIPQMEWMKTMEEVTDSNQDDEVQNLIAHPELQLVTLSPVESTCTKKEIKELEGRKRPAEMESKGAIKKKSSTDGNRIATKKWHRVFLVGFLEACATKKTIVFFEGSLHIANNDSSVVAYTLSGG
jgi:hypothetical protein